MLYNKEEREDYERRFNGYMMKVIKGTYKNCLKRRYNISEITSLNDCLIDGIEVIEEIAGEEDVLIDEKIEPEKLEEVMSSKKMYRAIKPLTYEEKLAVFLYVISEEKSYVVAERMGFLAISSANRLLKKAINKIRKNLKNMEDYDD